MYEENINRTPGENTHVQNHNENLTVLLSVIKKASKNNNKGIENRNNDQYI